ncbi:hypothetical protein NV379_02680 [Paenibacillus sp. N1-5-1-14]|uniref:hypothetical protein n=1 Tax=Paenibacillus radicibacter TaxID=2972488 RepID=UPI00215974CB|nr:hypothetical protein [Paenibacillus radicibacter]MCR8641552.1 hypothetical protein [Paenibacillus radicibacter]
MAVQNGVMVWGSSPLNPQVTITLSVNDDFSFSVDGTTYQIVIDQGTYVTSKEHFTSDLVAEVNKQLNAVSAPVKARLGGVCWDIHKDVLILEHKDTTSHHVIDNFAGTAKDTIFGEVLMTTPPNSQ